MSKAAPRTSAKVIALCTAIVLSSLSRGLAQEESSQCEAAFSKRDFEVALKYCAIAAAQGNAKAQDDMGLMYDYGHGTAQDYNAAFSWYVKAAKQGDSEGEYLLGGMYRFGHGVDRSDLLAAVWYKKAAKHGFAIAQSALGSVYESGGVGFAPDYSQAEFWYRKAADQGFKPAQDKLERLIKEIGSRTQQ
ncbi:tetratricopeptide repeat protein [Methylovirgula sp. 4M-Z18]|uniref:tetratricopeptide repeat protein n=1 Tax=Methylovirgula sp. 4M-Z18 TaxID=2293567 RepID=UPI000E2FD165|nr:tetratricopeptide repeat protein [Methylovirgula sp. 4M-Z18]